MNFESAGADVFCSLLSIILYSVNQYCDNMQYFLTRNAPFRNKIFLYNDSWFPDHFFYIQDPLCESLRRVRAARKAASASPHACASYSNSFLKALVFAFSPFPDGTANTTFFTPDRRNAYLSHPATIVGGCPKAPHPHAPAIRTSTF